MRSLRCKVNGEDAEIMFYKTYESRGGITLAVCDENICGKTLGKNFFVNPRFYKDKKGSKKKIIKLLRISHSANLVGKEAVECGIEAGVVDSENIVKIEGIPHAQVLLMSI